MNDETSFSETLDDAIEELKDKPNNTDSSHSNTTSGANNDSNQLSSNDDLESNKPFSDEDELSCEINYTDGDIQYSAFTYNLSTQLKQAIDDRNKSRKLNLALVSLVFLFGIISSYLFYSKSNVVTKYATVDADGRIVRITMSDDPLIKREDRIHFVERVARALNSISYYNREDILTEYSRYFLPSVFNELVSTLENDELLNKKSMNKYKITTEATITSPGRIIDDKVKGLNSNIYAEKIKVELIQVVRRRGLVVQKLKFYVWMNIARVPLNVSPFGYQIINYGITNQNKN